ncbi:sarcosine oxidase subunit delta [Acidithiobacillus sp. AMEEHan]|uniref:sarcosine oxidase subunit delta n=1 Tax=Acidithiobacillus sp. AMEEHan TaxID=2994951 RepID=UPI0027E50576|nr:sarcosine oxidase subunit delta [Acidithiobacillus sp. AMEEHan]
MKQLPCPICSTRNLSEFLYYGVRRDMPDPNTCTDAQWTDYLFNRAGSAGVKQEWWCHLPCNTWFLLERDTRTDEILGLAASVEERK